MLRQFDKTYLRVHRRVAPASTNVIDAVNQTKMGSLLKLYDGTFMLPETAHIFDSLYEFTCPECGRKLLLTSDEICVGKEII